MKKQNKFYGFLKITVGPIIKFCMRVKVIGAENEQPSGALIVCANHTAMFDVLSLGVSFKRQLRFLAKKELFKIPLLSSLITALGAYGVDRGKGDIGAIKKTLSILNDEEIVAMFPQGTRYAGVDPAKTEVKSGVGMMIYRSKADVQPVFIRVKNYKYRFLRKKEVIIGPAIKYDEFGFVNGGTDEYEKAAKLVFERILSLRCEGLDK